MSVYRTAQGKPLDMSALAARNERVRAVGNMSVNARGDTIDSHGKVLVPVTKKVGDSYQKTVTNRAANLVKRKHEITQPIETAPAPEMKIDITEEIELLADELQIEEDDDALEIEAIKAAETKEVAKPDFVVKPASEAPDFFEPEVKDSKKTKK